MENRTLPEFGTYSNKSLSKAQPGKSEHWNNQICVHFKLYPSLSNV